MDTQLHLFKQYLFQEMMRSCWITHYNGMTYAHNKDAENMLALFEMPYQSTPMPTRSVDLSYFMCDLRCIVDAFYTHESTQPSFEDSLLSIVCLLPKVQHALQQQDHPFTVFLQEHNFNNITRNILDPYRVLHITGDYPQTPYWLTQTIHRPRRIYTIYDDDYIKEWCLLRPDIATYAEYNNYSLGDTHSVMATTSMAIAVLLRYGYWPDVDDVKHIHDACETLTIANLHQLTPLFYSMITPLTNSPIQEEVTLYHA